MSRIGVSLTGMERSLLNRLADANAAIATSTLRKATGHQINRPADNPAAFKALSNLQTQLYDVRNTMKNVSAASSMVSQTQDAMSQIQTQLGVIRTELLKDEDGALTPDQRAESQAKIDTAIEAINSLATTSINGRGVLDGSAAFRTTGVNVQQVASMTVYGTGAGAGAPVSPTVYGEVIEAATQAELAYAGKAGLATIQADATFTVTGSLGAYEFSVTEDEALGTLRDEINATSHKTGVAAALAGDTLTLTSVGYGADATIAISVTDGTFTTTGGEGDGTAKGTDATVQINGQTYDGATSGGRTSGNTFTYAENGLRYDMELKAGYTGGINTITIGGGALQYAISTDLARPSVLSVQSLLPARLGGISGNLDQLRSGGSLAGLGSNTSQAIRVVDEALGAVTRASGNVDGFFNSQITSASTLLTEMETDLEDAMDGIDGVNDTEEDIKIAYYQALASNSVSGLAILANQRLAIIDMIRNIAGLR